MATVTTASGMSRLRIWMMPVPESDISHHDMNNFKLWSDDSLPEDPRLLVPLGVDDEHQSTDQQQRKLSSSMSSSSGYSGSSGSSADGLTIGNSVMDMKISTWKKMPEKTCGFCYMQFKRHCQMLGNAYPRAVDPGFWIGHNAKDENGNIVCPELRKLMCPLCFATGDKAHTLKFCPLQN